MFIGIDVAKAELVIAVRPSGERWGVPNSAAGYAALVPRLSAAALIVLEATGGYETAAVAALADAGLPVVVVNPRRVREFARATGQRAKTDRNDAAVLALFAERVQPAVRPVSTEEAQDLHAVLLRRRQLLDMLVAEKNRLGLARKPVRQRLRPAYRLPRARTRHHQHRAPTARRAVARVAAEGHAPAERARHRRGGLPDAPRRAARTRRRLGEAGRGARRSRPARAR